MVRRIVLLVSLLVAAGCGPQLPFVAHETTGSSPIVGGTTDTGDNAVALILFQDPSDASNAFVCTGTLISPNVILTAGHCVMQNEECNSPYGPATCHPNVASGYQVLGGSKPIDTNTWQITNPAWSADVTAVHGNPGYGSDSTGAPFNDIGILVIGSIHVLSGSAPSPMPWLSATTASAYATGASIRN